MKHHILKKKLKQRGWLEHEIAHAFDHFMVAEEHKHPLIKKYENYLVWITLLLSMMITVVIAFGLIPIYLTMPSYVVAICLLIMGFSFGFLIDILLREIEHLTHHHYIMASAFIQVFSLFAIYYALRISNMVTRFFPKGTNHEPLILSLVFFTGLAVPHAIYKYYEKRDYGEAEWI